jgi:hypothetical protein
LTQPATQIDEERTMKGVIAIALKELVSSRFGEGKWCEALKNAGIENEPLILPVSDLDDALVLKVVDGVCTALDISMEQATDAFGDYWVSEYSQKTYKSVYRDCDTARDFLLKMDEVHVSMTQNMQGARPPRFEYQWENDETLVMTYRSHRGLIGFMIGLIKGVGKFYGEKLKVNRLSDEQVRISFA